jgi:hypothetical protein
MGERGAAAYTEFREVQVASLASGALSPAHVRDRKPAPDDALREAAGPPG